MTDRLRDAAQRALESLDDLIRNTTDPGVEALGARHELARELSNTTDPMSDRIRLDDLTSDDLDRLYDQADRYQTAWKSAERDVTAAVRMAQDAQQRAEQAEARVAELEAETAKLIRWHREDGTALAKTRQAVDHLADRYRGAETRAEQAEDLLRVAHETSNRSEDERARAANRAEQAEAAIERVRVLADRIEIGAPWTANHRDTAGRIRAALDQPQQATT